MQSQEKPLLGGVGSSRTLLQSQVLQKVESQAAAPVIPEQQVHPSLQPANFWRVALTQWELYTRAAPDCPGPASLSRLWDSMQKSLHFNLDFLLRISHGRIKQSCTGYRGMPSEGGDEQRWPIPTYHSCHF